MAIGKNEVSAENLALAQKKIPAELRERAISASNMPAWNNIHDKISAELALARIFVRAAANNPIKEEAFQLLKEIIGHGSWMFVFDTIPFSPESIDMYFDLWCENITVYDWFRVIDNETADTKIYAEKLWNLPKPLEWWREVYLGTKVWQGSGRNQFVMRKILRESRTSEDFQKMISDKGFSYLTDEVIRTGLEKLKDYSSLRPFYDQCSGVRESFRLDIIKKLVEMKKTFDQCLEVFEIIPETKITR